MSNIAPSREALLARILQGDARATQQQRRAAFDNREVPATLRVLVEKVAQHAYKITDEDIAAAKAAGHSEDELFELVVCAAIGQASRQYDSALAALDAATKEG